MLARRSIFAWPKCQHILGTQSEDPLKIHNQINRIIQVQLYRLKINLKSLKVFLKVVNRLKLERVLSLE